MDLSSQSMAMNLNNLPIMRSRLTMDIPPPTFEFLEMASRGAQMVHSTSSSPPISPSGGSIYQCGFCGKSFQQRNTYQNHLRSHERETDDPYRCDICSKTFAVPARLTRHYRTHTGEKPYECEFCQKSFSVKENLSVHRRIHTKERPYKCDVCERAFEHSGKLHRHMRIHTGERPHCCQICNKTFIQSGQLVIHMRTHTGEKPYVCTVCSKGFTCSKQLKVHSRTHTGEKPYTCEICGKAFGYNHVLKLHQVAHYGEKVYKCTLCSHTFTSKKAMETHIKSHSGNIQLHDAISNSPRTISPDPILTSSDKENRDRESDSCSTEWDGDRKLSPFITNLSSAVIRNYISSPSPHMPPTPPSPDEVRKFIIPSCTTLLHVDPTKPPVETFRFVPSKAHLIAKESRKEMSLPLVKESPPPQQTFLPPFSVAGALSVLPHLSITTVPGTGTARPVQHLPFAPRYMDTPMPLSEPSVHLFPNSLVPLAMADNTLPEQAMNLTTNRHMRHQYHPSLHHQRNLSFNLPLKRKSSSPEIDPIVINLPPMSPVTPPASGPSSPEFLRKDSTSPSSSSGSSSPEASSMMNSSYSLPPRKRTKMILERMRDEMVFADGLDQTCGAELTNPRARMSSVIQYAGS